MLGVGQDTLVEGYDKVAVDTLTDALR